MDYVIDTSALVKRVLPEPHADALRAWFDEQVGDEAVFHAPVLILHEVAAVLGRRCPGQCVEDPHFIAKVGTQLTEGLELSDLAWQQVQPYLERLTAYDAAYLGMAKQNDFPLVTYDRDLAAVARGEGVAAVQPTES